MAQIRERNLKPNTGDKVDLPNGRAVTVMIWPGVDLSKPRKKSMVEAYIDGIVVSSTSIVDDYANESLAPQTLTVFVPRSADSA